MKTQLKRFGLSMIVVTILTVLAACGSSDKGNGQKSEPTASPVSETITYSASNGDIVIPKKPKKIALLADVYYGYFLELGYNPIAVTDYAIQNPFYKGLTDGVVNLGDGSSLELLLELEPDLIVAYSGNKAVDELQKIAPTVLIEYGKLNYKQQLKELGVMTGTEAKADEWIASWNKRIEQAKPSILDKVGERTVSIIQPLKSGMYVYGNSYGRGGEILYDEFGLKAPDLVQKEAIDSGVGYTEISLEKLPEFAGDYIFTAPWTTEISGGTVYESSLWKDLPAVKQNRVFEFDPIGFYFNDPISMSAQLDFFIEHLTK
ncbi:ABC transporter substrate-binding protein [Paenibacillus sp. GSMTC-2017]|uniref:ABC transporter substrate-binding protein n=1 Tax=Paenibacillus sp. GSMTC-2017 TaxID=2794350 RepID=UPI0018D828E5|nr:ABC transporter substrate-binding protein [Paenibacillus sp. GSMTC-2017]MBH5318762.1 ABC transporter substrate-binding protein [Paenibacillus sp. GSMTC-2017]